MTWLKAALITTAGLALALFAFGFILFSASVTQVASTPVTPADGIIVLTGGESRVAEGARLLKDGMGKRLLISGVNGQTRQQDLLRVTGLDTQKFNCCVDLGYTALDTYGNASEARTWAEARDYKSLVVVTSNYHMPRSLIELARAMPGIRLIPHPVHPKFFDNEAWWLSVSTTRSLASEYVKFLPSAIRFVVSRAMYPYDSRSIAEANVSIKDSRHAPGT